MFDAVSVGEGFLNQERSFWSRYGIALCSVVLATAARVSFQYFGDTSLPYLSFYPAVILVALLMGRGPGLLVVGFSTLAASLWIEPAGSFWISSPAHLLGMGLFLCVNFLILWVCDGLRGMLRRALRAEKALCETHRRETSALLGSISDGFVALDRDWHVTFLNPAAARLLSVPREELLGKVLWAVFPEADHLLFGREYRRAMSEGVFTSFEEFYPEPLHAWFEMRCYPTDEGLSVFFTDITERKAADQRLRQLSRAVDQSPSAVVITDIKGIIEYVNPKFTAITGYGVEEILGQKPSILKSGETPPEAYAELWKTIHSGREWRGEFHNKKKNGELFWEAASICPINDENGTITHYIAIKEDITERKAVESALLEAKQSAERANQAKDDFIAALSHELRTPLTPVLMAASALELDETLSDDLRKDISLIRHNVELEARLIDDLLDITKITYGKFSIRRERLDISDLLSRSVEIVRSDILHKGIDLRVDMAVGKMHVSADPTRLQQVFWNILRNAVKFTPCSGSIHVRAFPVGPETLSVEISDTGIGIEPDFIEQIFLPFRQGSVAGKQRYGGLGLGLAISKSIVEVHGGTITATSAGRKNGSTFSVRLPMILADDHSQTAPSIPEQSVTFLRILLVEDHDETRSILTRLLTREGHSVAAFGTCVAALNAARSQPADEPFQTLISDLSLPDGSGHDLVRAIKADFPNLTALALSGFGTEADLEKSRLAGFAKHLTKPISFPELRRMLGVVMQGNG